ncbi:MAG: NAD(P)-dependent oxidoreductase, partial [Candidatus Azambacteria bacterium]|nr:NAD(P)-dependent oxidoreductase [Candidatus Azambacteria bacterium]
DLSGKTLGVVGLGRIGSRVAYHAVKGFDMKVLYYDVNRNENFEKEFGAIYLPLEDLLKQSDFISIHVPLLDSTRHLINAENLKLMKPSAYLVNTSRGPIIDEMALAYVLTNKVIKGAALDVFEFEPNITPELLQLDNVILTPHIASATEETRSKMSALAAINIIEALESRIPPNLVK